MSRGEKAALLTVLTFALLLCGSMASFAQTSKGAYPELHNSIPNGQGAGLTVDQRSKLKEELNKARDRQQSQVKARRRAGT
jgi:hypothetical protein